MGALGAGGAESLEENGKSGLNRLMDINGEMTSCKICVCTEERQRGCIYDY